MPGHATDCLVLHMPGAGGGQGDGCEVCVVALSLPAGTLMDWHKPSGCLLSTGWARYATVLCQHVHMTC